MSVITDKRIKDIENAFPENLRQELSAIKSILPKDSGVTTKTYTSSDFEQGSVNESNIIGYDTNKSKRVSTKDIFIVGKQPFKVNLTEEYEYFCRYFNSAGVIYKSSAAWTAGTGADITDPESGASSVKFLIRKTSGDGIFPTSPFILTVTGEGGEVLTKVPRQTVYNVLNYGLSPNLDDNCKPMEDLLSLVERKGGGIVYFPIGTYKFMAYSGSGHTRAAITPRNNISFLGESMTGTVLKMVAQGYYSLFNRLDTTKESPLVGCKFMNFTVDAYDVNPTVGYTTSGKAFYFQNLKDSVFRDLIIKGTPSTSVGIDFLVNVFIDNITVIDGGRLVDDRRLGGSGIGIGTDYFDEENFIISNCITIGCGNYGIFIESQGPFSSGATMQSRGMIVNNCVCRDGKNSGMGIRTGRKVIIEGCTAYNNKNNGVELKWKIDGVKLSNCIISDNVGEGIVIDTTSHNGYTSNIQYLDIENNLICNNTGNGISIKGVTAPVNDVSLKGNNIYDNQASGLKVEIPTTGLSVMNNLTKRNAGGIEITSDNQADTVVKGNVFMDGTSAAPERFIGVTEFNELI